jgi:hypothetical protein
MGQRVGFPTVTSAAFALDFREAIRRLGEPALAMKSRRTIFLTVPLLILCGGLAAVFWPEKPEPVYNGRTLSSWVLDPGSSSYLSFGAKEAVLSAGPDGIPVYLKWLQYKQSTLKKAEHFLAVRCNRWFGPCWRTDDPRQRGPWGAQLAFAVLQDKGQDAIPALFSQITRSGSVDSFLPALRCLGSIGRPAIPALITLTTNDNSDIREWSAGTLVKEWKDERVIPHLTLLLNHPSHATRVAVTNCMDYVAAVNR